MLIRMSSSETQVGGWILREIHPPHRVDTELLGGFFEPDRRAVRLVHRLALLVLNEPVTEQRFERSLFDGIVGLVVTHHRGQREHRVEPVAELAGEALGDQIRLIPLLPVVAIVVVVHGRERNDSRVEPRVADVFDPRHQVAGLRVPNLDAVDPRSVRRVAFEAVPAFNRSLFEFSQRAHDFEVAGFLINPDRQRETPEAFLRDHPVAHVAEPLALAILPVDAGRQPFNLPCDIFDFFPPVHIDEPLVDQPEDKFIARPPAMRIDVRVSFNVDQQALFFELLENEFRRFLRDGLFAGEVSKAFAVRAVLFERSNGDEAVLGSHFMVDVTAARRDVDDARPLAGHNVSSAA